ncbi:MAG: hypothetical protein FD180_1511 [Planctomycetota bacterium]|nr:MAG: hypothetical protein FD180_1511 [Planctomycetota bacterium]
MKEGLLSVGSWLLCVGLAGMAWAEGPAAPKPVTLEELAGKEGEQGRKCVLVKLGGKEVRKEYRIVRKGGKLILKGKHDWEDGRYDPVSGKLTFDKTPALEEMPEETGDDPPRKIPPWARLQVEGSLKWKLELTVKWKPAEETAVAGVLEGSAGTGETPAEYGRFVVEGKWYPGRIKWETKDNKDRAWVPEGEEGRGRPIPVEYHVVPDDYTIAEMELRLLETSEARRTREEKLRELKKSLDEAQKALDAARAALREKEARFARLQDGVIDSGQEIRHLQGLAESDARTELPGVVADRDKAGAELLAAMKDWSKTGLLERIAKFKKNNGLAPEASIEKVLNAIPAEGALAVDIRALQARDKEWRDKLIRAEDELARSQAKFEEKRGVADLVGKSAESARKLAESRQEVDEAQALASAAGDAVEKAWQECSEATADLKTHNAKGELRIIEARAEAKGKPVYGTKFEKMNELFERLDREMACQERLKAKRVEFEGYRKSALAEMRAQMRAVEAAQPGTLWGVRYSDWAQLAIEFATDLAEVAYGFRKGGPRGVAVEFAKKCSERATQYALTGTTAEFYDPWEKAVFQKFLEDSWQSGVAAIAKGGVDSATALSVGASAEKFGWESLRRAAEGTDYDELEKSWDRYTVFKKAYEKTKQEFADEGVLKVTAKNISREFFKDIAKEGAKMAASEFFNGDLVARYIIAERLRLGAVHAWLDADKIFNQGEETWLESLKTCAELRERLRKREGSKVFVQDKFKDGEELSVELIPSPDPDPAASTRKLRIRVGGHELGRLSPAEKYLSRAKLEDLEHDRKGGVKLLVEFDPE